MAYSTAVLERLDRGMRARLTLVLNADGSPKLVRRWLEERSWRRAHHTLTRADNAADQFLADLIGALNPLLPVEVRTPPVDERTLAGATVDLLNALLGVPEDFALVLEDYDVIASPAIHGAVGLMVNYPPPHLHLYLTSRTVPPLPLARLRVRQQLVEIDLREH